MGNEYKIEVDDKRSTDRSVELGARNACAETLFEAMGLLVAQHRSDTHVELRRGDDWIRIMLYDLPMTRYRGVMMLDSSPWETVKGGVTMDDALKELKDIWRAYYEKSLKEISKAYCVNVLEHQRANSVKQPAGEVDITLCDFMCKLHDTIEHCIARPSECEEAHIMKCPLMDFSLSIKPVGVGWEYELHLGSNACIDIRGDWNAMMHEIWWLMCQWTGMFRLPRKQ